MKPIALHRERPVPEELERQDRLSRPVLDDRNSTSSATPSTMSAIALAGAPRLVVPPRLVKRTIARQPAGEHRRAEIVDRVLDALGREWKTAPITKSASAPSGRLT